MKTWNQTRAGRIGLLGLALLCGVLAVAGVILFSHGAAMSVRAAPIDPPEGYPKLNRSTKTVTPTLAGTGGETLFYKVEIVNTGAYRAEAVHFSDWITGVVSYNGDAQASNGADPQFDSASGLLSWSGDVEFDSSVWIEYSVTVDPGYEGTVENSAVIEQAEIDAPVIVSAQAMITDQPVLTIEKTSEPALPGPNKPLTYYLTVENTGQPAEGLALTVSDELPPGTQSPQPGADGSFSKGTVTWNRTLDMATGDTSVFSFTVKVKDLVSGTVLTNDNYSVSSEPTGLTAGAPYTVTVVDPDLVIYKEIFPDPPGANREAEYRLTVRNRGSLATGLVISDVLPANVSYAGGGDETGDLISWTLPELDTGEEAEFTFMVQIGDISSVELANTTYGVCSSEGMCAAGQPLVSQIQPANFKVRAEVDPIAKKPGGGQDTTVVTPTLWIHNAGPGSALDATALLTFGRISVSNADVLKTIPPDRGTFTPGPACETKCVNYYWSGDIGYGETITITTIEGQSTIGGEEGTPYTATIVLSDTLEIGASGPFTATAVGHVTKRANLIPVKQGPAEIAPGYPMTYTIRVYNSGLTAHTPPYPVLHERLPAGVTLLDVSDDGLVQPMTGTTVISWTLPDMSTGEELFRSFSVQVDEDLISGSLIVNDDYGTWWQNEISQLVYTNGVTTTLNVITDFVRIGEPVTTVVKEIGLIDSFKTVEPALALPGPDNLLTFTVHVVNSSPTPLYDVQLEDLLPWQHSTYLRDATASSGELISDIVSLNWSGDVGAYDSQAITLSVLVDPYYKGPITNTAVLTHPALREPVEVSAVAYITDEPVLQISKKASPDPVRAGQELQYSLQVVNLGQKATDVLVADTLPENTQFLPGSTSGQLTNGRVEWRIPALQAGEKRTLTFKVLVLGGQEIVNQDYEVSCAEGVRAYGPPVVTEVKRLGTFLPVLLR